MPSLLPIYEEVGGKMVNYSPEQAKELARSAEEITFFPNDADGQSRTGEYEIYADGVAVRVSSNAPHHTSHFYISESRCRVLGIALEAELFKRLYIQQLHYTSAVEKRLSRVAESRASLEGNNRDLRTDRQSK